MPNVWRTRLNTGRYMGVVCEFVHTHRLPGLVASTRECERPRAARHSRRWMISGLIGSPLLRPAGLLASLTETFTSGLSTVRSPSLSPDMTTVATGQFPPAGLSPAGSAASVAALGAEPSRPATLLSTLRPPITRPGARLATGPPAMALTGLDFHQLDSFEGFHQLISDPPFPRFSQRDSARSQRPVEWMRVIQ
jgi:hypothetical protein